MGHLLLVLGAVTTLTQTLLSEWIRTNQLQHQKKMGLRKINLQR